MAKKKFNIKREVSKHWKIIGVCGFLLTLIAVLYAMFNTDDGVYPITTTTTTRYECGVYCQTDGEWNASRTKHDTGRLADDGSWMSVKDGFGYLVGSVYIPVSAGAYDVTFEMKIDDNTRSENACYIEVAHNYGIPIIGEYVKANDFNQPDTYQDFTLRFNTPDDLNVADFRIHYDHTNTTINVRKITLKKVY